MTDLEKRMEVALNVLSLFKEVESNNGFIFSLRGLIKELSEREKELQESLTALQNKLGDNCCACSYEKPDDVCDVHSPRLKEFKEREAKLVEALRKIIKEDISQAKDADYCNSYRNMFCSEIAETTLRELGYDDMQ